MRYHKWMPLVLISYQISLTFWQRSQIWVIFLLARFPTKKEQRASLHNIPRNVSICLSPFCTLVVLQLCPLASSGCNALQTAPTNIDTRPRRLQLYLLRRRSRRLRAGDSDSNAVDREHSYLTSNNVPTLVTKWIFCCLPLLHSLLPWLNHTMLRLDPQRHPHAPFPCLAIFWGQFNKYLPCYSFRFFRPEPRSISEFYWF